MQMTKSLIYAIQALNEYRKGDQLTSEEIARKLDISLAYSKKVNRFLMLAGIIASDRGPGVGYTLVKDLEKVPAAELVAKIDGGLLDDERGDTPDMKRIRRNLREKLIDRKVPVSTIL